LEGPWRVVITPEVLDPSEALGHVQDDRAGAIHLFVGTTRRWTEERETRRLRYDAYPDMALQQMERLLEEAGRRWTVLRGAIIHRTGIVEVGETSVLIAVATQHRAAAFEACRYLIDTLKEDVPIWKKEEYVDGTSEWVEAEG
jgi:molybdopterin synthase catalytic subunit